MNGIIDWNNFLTASISLIRVGVTDFPVFALVIRLHGPITFLQRLISDTNNDLLTSEVRFADEDISFKWSFSIDLSFHVTIHNLSDPYVLIQHVQQLAYAYSIYLFLR